MKPVGLIVALQWVALQRLSVVLLLLASGAWLSREAAAAENRVLELDGTGSYVELPARVFDGLAECTVEGWVRWQSVRFWSRFFEVGRGSWEGFNLGQGRIASQLSAYFPSVPDEAGVAQIDAPGLLRLGEWGHLAMVIGRERVTVFYNGQEVAAGRLQGGLTVLPVKERFVLGRNNWGTFGEPGVVRQDEAPDPRPASDRPTQEDGHFEDFRGQMDEVRVWNRARSAEEIRRTLSVRLTGTEPNLVALWNFDDGSATDATGRFHGELRRQARTVPAAFPTAGPGARLQPVVQLDGNDSYVELPPNIFRRLPESTVEAWIRCAGLQPEGEARFFEVGDGALGRFYSISPGLWGADARSAVLFTIVGPKGWKFHNAWAKNAIQPGRWFHLAAVSGSGGMRFYLNGVLTATNSHTGSFASIDAAGPAFLGRSVQSTATRNRTFQGEMTDVRVWDRSRSGQEIRGAMFARLRGDEEGLVGLWDFQDGTARDRSRSGHHGELKGNARILGRRLPAAEELEQPATLVLTALDEAGDLLPGAQFDLLQGGQTVASVTVDEIDDNRQLVVFPNQQPYEVWARRSDAGATLSGLRLERGEIREVRLTLKARGAISGTLRTLADTPQANVVVQALDAAGNSAGTALTDAQGTYRLEDLPLGRYQVRCHVLGGFRYHTDQGRSEFRSSVSSTGTLAPTARLVTVSPGRTERIDLQFPPFKKGTWRTYKTRDGLPHNIVVEIYPDPVSGMLWLATAGGVSRFDGQKFANLTVADGLNSSFVNGIVRELNGVLWIATDHGGVTRYDPAQRMATTFTIKDGLLSDTVICAAREQSAGIWFGTENGAIRYDASGFRNFRAGDGLAPGVVQDILAEPNGTVWFAHSGGGVSRFDGRAFRQFTTADGLVDNSVHSIYRDVDGTLWFGTRSGVSRFDGQQFATLGPREGLVLRATHKILSFHRDADGVLWLASCSQQADGDGSGVWRYDGQSFVNFTAADGLPSDSIWDIQSDLDGGLWFACWDGLARFDPETFVNFTASDGMPDDSNVRLHVASDRTLWIGGARHGVTKFDGREFSRPTGAEDLAGGAFGPAIRSHPDGSVWFGGFGNGLFRYAAMPFRNSSF